MVRVRASVSLENFLRVTVADRDNYRTASEAAKALGMTEASFKQRLQKERKNYPTIFSSIQKYESSSPRRVSEADAIKMIEQMKVV